MVCDNEVYGCNIDRDFSGPEPLSVTFASIPVSSCGTQKTMEVSNWGSHYCIDFWYNDSSYVVNAIDQDGQPIARLSNTHHCDHMGGIGVQWEVSYYSTICGCTPETVPDYVELYVK